jgi:sporulation protein YlmC with PRC-barrel domain
MLTAKSHTNKPLVSLTDGKIVGEIKDLYVDRDMRQVAAVHLGKEGLLKRKALMLARSAVQVYGVDVWLVAGSDKVAGPEDIADADTFVLVGDLRGREIQTEGGTKVGVLDDVVLDAEARVLGFVLGKTYVQGPLADRKTIAREAVIKLGSKDAPMTVELAQAENLPVPSG